MVISRRLRDEPFRERPALQLALGVWFLLVAAGSVLVILRPTELSLPMWTVVASAAVHLVLGAWLVRVARRTR